MFTPLTAAPQRVYTIDIPTQQFKQVLAQPNPFFQKTLNHKKRQPSTEAKNQEIQSARCRLSTFHTLPPSYDLPRQACY